MLSDLLRSQFDGDVRYRGEQYQREGRVEVVSDDESILQAKVRGARQYEVDIELMKGKVIVNCTCPYADGYEPCKHIWASVLEADRYGFASDVTGPLSL
jgi:uncharacterized Zn finger protein